MCLLITQPAAAPTLSDAWLDDWYSYNSDGVGVMYAENGLLHIKKALPRTSEEFIAWFRKHAEGRDCAIHLRMKTHGLIDMENCHPYEIFSQKDGHPMWMMHNGILSTGNSADVSKSDTWHYVRDFLRPLLKADPSVAFTPAFRKLVEAHIGGSNKFVIMDYTGAMATFNAKAGGYWGGRWLSNTYAWTADHIASSADDTTPAEAAAEAAGAPLPVPVVGAYYGGQTQRDLDWCGYVAHTKSTRPSAKNAKKQPHIRSISDGHAWLIRMCKQELRAARCVLSSDLADTSHHQFIKAFGEHEYEALVDMNIAGEIDDSQFVRCLTDRAYATECFGAPRDGAEVCTVPVAKLPLVSTAAALDAA